MRRFALLRRSGVTLTELIVAMFLFGLLSTILLKAFLLASRASHEELERVAVESRLLLAVNALERDLLATSPAGVSLSADGSRLALQPISEVAPSQRVVFAERYLLWLWNASANVLQKTQATSRPDGLPFNGNPARWTSSDLTAYVSAQTMLRLDGVALFKVSCPSSPHPAQISNPFRIEVTCLLQLGRTRKEVPYLREIQLRTSSAR